MFLVYNPLFIILYPPKRVPKIIQKMIPKNDAQIIPNIIQKMMANIIPTMIQKIVPKMGTKYAHKWKAHAINLQIKSGRRCRAAHFWFVD